MEKLFGRIEGGKMVLNDCGRVMDGELKNLAASRADIEIDSCCIMPDHVHIIVHIKQWPRRGDAFERRPLRPKGPQPGSLGAIIAKIKSTVSRRINEQRATPGRPIWHRNYFEQIIRGRSHLEAVRSYIRNNPRNAW